MGEAKRRKVTEPHYGRVPKIKLERGIVVSPPMRIDGSSLQIEDCRLNAQNLRFWLLFWDRLVWPTSNIIHIEESPDELFLLQEGVLERPTYTFYGDGAQGVLQSQLTAFQQQEKKHPGLWALAQGENALKAAIPNQVGRGLLIELHHALPLPSPDVPLAEILEFKEKRLPELYQLRAALDDIYLKVNSSGDSALALNKAIYDIDKACSDLLKVNKEWKYPKLLANASLGLSIPLAPITLIASAFAGAPFDLALSSAVLSSMLPQVSLNFGQFGLKSINKNHPYLYAIQAHKELRF